MRIILAISIIFSFIPIHSQECDSIIVASDIEVVKKLKIEVRNENNLEHKLLHNQYSIRIEPVCSSRNYNECMGIILEKKKETIYFETNGKYIHKFNLKTLFEPQLIFTVHEVTGTWNDDYGDTFLHDMKLGEDGYIYAVAENCILKINAENGEYSTIIKEGFCDPWGAYGIDLDDAGNIFVGDHHGGIHVYIKNHNWSRRTIIASSTVNSDSYIFS